MNPEEHKEQPTSANEIATENAAEKLQDASIENEPEIPRLDASKIPAEGVRLKMINGEPLTMAEKLKAGRDRVLSGDVGNGIITHSDHAYRAISLETLTDYLQKGGVEIDKHGDIYIRNENNKGVDWYLGGFAPRYGEIVIETPATADHFALVQREDGLLGNNPNVLHIKSEGGDNAIRLEDITRILRITKKEGGEFEISPFDLAAHKEGEVAKIKESDLAEAERIKQEILK